MTANTRTYLCPDCDGWGAIEGNDGPTYVGGTDPQNDWQENCLECDGSGVVVLTYADADRLDLQPWDGLNGKVLEGVRAAKRGTDPLLDMGRLRAEHVAALGGSFYYGIYRMRAMRKCSGLAQAEMLAMATRCVTRANELRAAMELAA